MDTNLTELKDKIVKAAADVNAAKDERQEINADIKAIRENLHAKGIKKEAFDMAMRYMGWDADRREGFDLAYDIVREALGMPVKAQGDLFDAERQAAAKKAAQEAKGETQQ